MRLLMATSTDAVRAVRPRAGGQRVHNLIASRANSGHQVAPPIRSYRQLPKDLPVMTMQDLSDVASGVRRPGLGAGFVRVQRAGIPGEGAFLTDLATGDTLTLCNVEGGQTALIAIFAKPTRSRHLVDMAPAVSAAPDRRSDFAACLSDDVVAALARRGFALQSVTPLQAFGRASAPGAVVILRANAPCLVLVAAPTAGPGPDGLAVAGPLDVTIRRSGNPLEAVAPPPLAETRADLLVPRRQAIAYEVKAGEYIQIVDIAGRQCSDFMAFPRRAIDKGLERFIDTTVTRTLVRGGYPRPGLYDKYFDQDMQPLLQVVQDTCGRHDTFGLACTRRTYEAYGMPGHDNCSDNISQAMAPYGVKERLAWPAINLFFNTAVDQGNAITSDEGWSRPGDYVLMKALTDLVCVSTACPDDTSPINGWDPTDAQVRLYDDNKLFRKSVAFRMTPDSAPVLTRETGFHSRTSALTRNFVVAKDFWVPHIFLNEGAIAEYWATREAATIQDFSQLRKFDVSGPDAESLLDYVLTRDVRKLAPGQVLYSAACRPTGAMFDDGTLFRLGPNTFRWMSGDARMAEWMREQATAKSFNAHIRTVTDTLNSVAVQGPRSREILSEVVWTPDDQPKIIELRSLVSG